MQFKFATIIFIFLILSFRVESQKIGIRGSFETDSIRLCEEAAYHLIVTYPGNLKIILPDSTYKYGTFELDHRKWFPTEIRNSMLYDSVIYYLTTFELDSVLYFQLPVFLIQKNDCTVMYTSPDSLFLKQVITQVPDSLKLKSDTRLLRFRRLFNYPLWALSTGILIFIIFLVIIIFGKRISRLYRIYIMRRRHRKFVEKFYLKLGKLRDSHNDNELEHILHDWKRYMENLEMEPYTKLTTRELVKLYNDTVLIDNLKAIDRFIYGNIKDRPMHEHFAKLLDYSVNRFKVRLREVQDGN